MRNKRVIGIPEIRPESWRVFQGALQVYLAPLVDFRHFGKSTRACRHNTVHIICDLTIHKTYHPSITGPDSFPICSALYSTRNSSPQPRIFSFPNRYRHSSIPPTYPLLYLPNLNLHHLCLWRFSLKMCCHLLTICFTI